MIYVVIGFALIAIKEVPGLIRRREVREISAVSLISAVALYYSVGFALALPVWSPFVVLEHLLLGK
jgi:hypothetical protein